MLFNAKDLTKKILYIRKEPPFICKTPAWRKIGPIFLTAGIIDGNFSVEFLRIFSP